MLVILDPPGNVPIFLSVTQLLDTKERHKAAWLASATAFLVISMFAIGGRTVLEYLNISVPALQGAGGLMLLLVALHWPTVSVWPKKTIVATMAPGPASNGVPRGTMATDVRSSGLATA